MPCLPLPHPGARTHVEGVGEEGEGEEHAAQLAPLVHLGVVLRGGGVPRLVVFNVAVLQQAGGETGRNEEEEEGERARGTGRNEEEGGAARLMQAAGQTSAGWQTTGSHTRAAHVGVVGAMGDAPAVVGHHDGGVRNVAHKVVQGLRQRQGAGDGMVDEVGSWFAALARWGGRASGTLLGLWTPADRSHPGAVATCPHRSTHLVVGEGLVAAVVAHHKQSPEHGALLGQQESSRVKLRSAGVQCSWAAVQQYGGQAGQAAWQLHAGSTNNPPVQECCPATALRCAPGQTSRGARPGGS